MNQRPSIRPLGDSAMTITFGDTITEELADLVVAQSRRISGAGIRGVTDIVSSYASIGVHYDPDAIAYDELQARLAPLLEDPSVNTDDAGSRVHHIRVRYDGEDLDEVARRTQLTTAEVVSIHIAALYRVFVIGFVPGFAYLGPLDARLALPRRDSPRKRVPPGSVAIAERQTGIYPSATPGGWHIIGSTTERMFDPSRLEPSLLSVGDRVKFES